MILFALPARTLLFDWHGLLIGLMLTAAGAAGYQIAALLIARYGGRDGRLR